MKKVLTILTSLIITASCATVYCKTENASALWIKYEEGDIITKGMPVLSPEDIIEVKVSDTKSFLSFANGSIITVMQTRPESDDDLNMNSGIYILFKDENYIMKRTVIRSSEKNQSEIKYEKIDCSTEVKYNIDCESGTMINMVTGEKLISEAQVVVNFYVFYKEKNNVQDMYVDKRGNFVSPNSPESVISVRHGDIDENGIVELNDLTLLSQCILKDIDFSEVQNAAGDADGNGEIDICDLAVLKQYIMKDNVKLGK